MGQRHQAFLIARVVPHGGGEAKYRCVAAYHHQWCYGTLPLRAARRCLTLVRQKENADIIREELRSIDGKFGRFGEEPDMPATPCPFIASLLGTSWNVDLSVDFPYISGVTFDNSVLPAGMGSWEGDNNDGITVIDITNPEDSTYCFLQNTTPLSGRQYISGYYTIPERKDGEVLEGLKQTIVDSVADLEGEKVLRFAALLEAWPKEYQEAAEEQETPSTEATSDATTSEDTTRVVPTLTDISLRSAVIKSVESGDTERLEEMLWLPGKADIIRDVLFEQAPFPDGGLPLLTKILEEHTSKSSTLDLSGVDLSDAQILQILPSVSSVSSLNLSRVPRITIEAVHGLLTQLSHLKRLVLMNCPAISDKDIVQLSSSQPQLFYKLEALMHPAFLSLSDDTAWLPEISFLTLHSNTFPPIRGVSLPFFSPAGVVQGFTDFLDAVINGDPYSLSSGGGTGIAAAFTAASRRPGQKWNERTVVAVPRMDHRKFVTAQKTSWLFVFNYDLYTRDSRGWAFLRFPQSPKPKAETEEEKVPVQVPEKAKSEGDIADAFKQDEPRESNEDADSDKVNEPTEDDVKASVTWEVHDLQGFLRLAAEEGRPAASEDAVARAEELIKKIADGPYGEGSECRLLTFKAALDCVRVIQHGRQRLETMSY